jgi:hypothetical protein
MADYKELLRRAVEALPENNGAARRAVYEKARAALVGQLRAIHPPLPARDITTHRLQLEDCIRQVEQEASEAVIAGMGAAAHDQTPPPPVFFETNAANKTQPALVKPALTKPSKPTLVKEAPKALPAGGTIEDIIAAANAESPAPAPAPRKAKADGKGATKPIPMRLASPPPPPPAEAPDEDEDEEPARADILPPKPAAKPNGRPLPAIVARAEAAKGRSNSTAFGVPGGDKPYDAPRRGPSIEPRREAAARSGNAAVARQPAVEPIAFLSEPKVAAAMSAVREVELEPQPADPQRAIDRAIETLDREARGESEPAYDEVEEVEEIDARPNGKAKKFNSLMPGNSNKKPARQQPLMPGRGKLAALPPPPAPEPRAPLGARRGRERDRDQRDTSFGESGAFPRARAERSRSGMNAIAVFGIVFAVLLAGAAGAGYWAVSQGYLDVGKMFSGAPPAAEGTTPSAARSVTADVAPATGVGNTAAPAAAPAPAAELPGDDRLTPEPALTGEAPLALAATSQPAGEERLAAESPDAAATAEVAVASLDSSAVAGSQSLLLEASDDGTTGAIPFSGTVDWSKGTDELGQPTLVGKANIPARNLGVDMLIRKNADPSLPASHLMEINFRVSESFIGGSVAGLPGVLLKNEELVQGTPLVGASARVVGNSFLFALSASPEDLSKNSALLTEQKWIDLALIYATGKRAIITLEKDSAADGLFKEVVTAWSQQASN